MYMFACLLNLSLITDCIIILTNIKQETSFSWFSSHFFQPGFKPSTVNPYGGRFHTHLLMVEWDCLFILCVCIWAPASEWLSRGFACMCVLVNVYVPYVMDVTMASLNCYHYQPRVSKRGGSLQQICDCFHRTRNEASHCREWSHTDMFKPWPVLFGGNLVVTNI